jgi:uncharacterized membrane protein YgdD (TMEM256/DUF423 family)
LPKLEFRPMQHLTSSALFPRALAASGAASAAFSVALSAYAAHALQGQPQSRLQLAAVFLFGHGVALAALAPATAHRLGHLALLAMAAGAWLFGGSLTAAVLLGWPAPLAPLGGLLLIGSWLSYALHLLRR